MRNSIMIFEAPAYFQTRDAANRVRPLSMSTERSGPMTCSGRSAKTSMVGRTRFLPRLRSSFVKVPDSGQKRPGIHSTGMTGCGFQIRNRARR